MSGFYHLLLKTLHMDNMFYYFHEFDCEFQQHVCSHEETF